MDLSRALKILAITEYAGPDDLKKAFRTQAHVYHPDKNTGDDAAQRFRDLLAAYQFCSTHVKDVERHFGFSSPGGEDSVVQNLDDIFEDIFGFSRQGRVLGYEEPQVVYLTIADFLFGAIRNEKLLSYRKCSDCDGVGAQKGTLARICRQCFGRGFYVRKNGFAEERKICVQCAGRGREIERLCKSCGGFGRTQQKHKQRFQLPVGLSPHGIYTLTSVDLETNEESEIFVEVRPLRDPVFQIDHYNLMCEYHMDFTDHKKDIVLNLTTPLGGKIITIPAGAKNGDQITIAGAGLFKDGNKSAQGDLVVRLKQKKIPWWRKLLQKRTAIT